MSFQLNLSHRTAVYLVTYTADEDAQPEPFLYDISIWISGEPTRFRPTDSGLTALQRAALQLVMDELNLCPVLESV